MASTGRPSQAASFAASISSPGRTGLVSAEVDTVISHDPARDGGLVDLVGPVVDAGRALVGVPVREGRLVGEAGRAPGLDGAVEDAVEDARDEELDRGDVVARGVGALGGAVPGG